MFYMLIVCKLQEGTIFIYLLLYPQSLEQDTVVNVSCL